MNATLGNNPSCLNKITTKVTALYGTVNQTISVNKKYAAVDLFHTYMELYSDGVQASYLDDAGQPFHGTNESHLLVNIPQYNESWTGEYAIALYANCYSILQGCGYGRGLICYNLFYIHIFFVSVLQVTITTLGKKTRAVTVVKVIIWFFA